ncbi:MAG: nitroreductase [Bacteroidales bacterium]|nr:nitroreductase [Bacteroidales bacterium]
MTVYGHLKNYFQARRKMLADSWQMFRENLKYNASIRSSKDPDKLCYMILREAHTLEKGMSLREPRQGFGKQKAEHLMERMEEYAGRYGYNPAVSNALSILEGYLQFSRESGENMDMLSERFRNLLEKFGNPDYPRTDCTIVMEEFKTGSFEDVILGRHSCRYFKKKEVGVEVINKALELASHTPSACNRQAWRTHVFSEEACAKLLEWQGGCRGFEDEPAACILVTADRKAFLHYEMFQPYIDGGMYAMNLINCLQSLSLATIPLSCGFHSDKLAALRGFGIPANEVPIVIIGLGYPEDKVRVAASIRKQISETNTFH